MSLVISYSLKLCPVKMAIGYRGYFRSEFLGGDAKRKMYVTLGLQKVLEIPQSDVLEFLNPEIT